MIDKERYFDGLTFSEYGVHLFERHSLRLREDYVKVSIYELLIDPLSNIRKYTGNITRQSNVFIAGKKNAPRMKLHVQKKPCSGYSRHWIVD